MKVIDAFAGIGGFRQALDSIPDTECVLSVEINEYAKQVYEANFGTGPAS